jgi:hypothetical protein
MVLCLMRLLSGRTNFLAIARANPGTVPVPVQGGGPFYPSPRGWGGAQLNAVWPKGTRARAALGLAATSNQRPHRRFSRTEAQVTHDQTPPTLPEACSSLSLQGFGLGGGASKAKEHQLFCESLLRTKLLFFWYPLGTHGWKVLKRLNVSH